MRIDPKLITIAPVPSKATRSEEKPRTEERGTIVEISTAGAAAMESTSSPEIAAKVAKLRAQVATGSYKIDYEKLAERIVDDDIQRGGETS